MSESNPTEPDSEPVFEAAQASYAEPVFAPAPEEPSPLPLDEPVFAAEPVQAHGVTLPVDAPHAQVGWDASASDGTPSAPNRRLGRTGPVWAGVSVVTIVILVAIWFSLGRRAGRESVPSTPPVSGVVGSLVLNDAGTPQTAAETSLSTPTTTPQPRLSPGMQVVVGNTDGQGIRLRSAPGTEALTLGIYDDGAPFLVLSPGGDYASYPVEADGYFWYRIRVVNDPADQLVGWAAGDFLVSSEQ